jgi:hypothetical protein
LDITWVVVEVCFEFRFGSSLSSFRHGDGSLFSHALADQFDAIGVVHEAIEDSVSDGRISDDLVPPVDRNLAGDDGRAPLVAILDDLEEVTTLIVVELFGPPVIQNEQIGPGQRLQHPGISAVAPCQSKLSKEPWGAMIGDGEVLPASLVAEGTGKPALSDTGGAGQQEPMTLSDPVAACEFEEQGTIETAFGTEVGIFDQRVMA